MSDASRAAIVRKWATARKASPCRQCGAVIAPGTRYWQVAPPFVPATRFCVPACENAYVSAP